MGVRMMTAITEIEFVTICLFAGAVMWLGAVYVGAV
jgi:hypothetical protein